jgi:hypothetical protein
MNCCISFQVTSTGLDCKNYSFERHYSLVRNAQEALPSGDISRYFNSLWSRKIRHSLPEKELMVINDPSQQHSDIENLVDVLDSSVLRIPGIAGDIDGPRAYKLFSFASEATNSDIHMKIQFMPPAREFRQRYPESFHDFKSSCLLALLPLTPTKASGPQRLTTSIALLCACLRMAGHLNSMKLLTTPVFFKPSAANADLPTTKSSAKQTRRKLFIQVPRLLDRTAWNDIYPSFPPVPLAKVSEWLLSGESCSLATYTHQIEEPQVEKIRLQARIIRFRHQNHTEGDTDFVPMTDILYLTREALPNIAPFVAYYHSRSTPIIAVLERWPEDTLEFDPDQWELIRDFQTKLFTMLLRIPNDNKTLSSHFDGDYGPMYRLLPVFSGTQTINWEFVKSICGFNAKDAELKPTDVVSGT